MIKKMKKNALLVAIVATLFGLGAKMLRQLLKSHLFQVLGMKSGMFMVVQGQLIW